MTPSTKRINVELCKDWLRYKLLFSQDSWFSQTHMVKGDGL